MGRCKVSLQELSSHILREVSSAHTSFETEQYYAWIHLLETRRKHNDIAGMGAYQYLGAQAFDLEMDLEPMRYSWLKRFGWWLGIGKRPNPSDAHFKLAKKGSKRTVHYKISLIRDDTKGYKTEHEIDSRNVDKPENNYVTGVLA